MTAGELIRALGGELLNGSAEMQVLRVGSADGADPSQAGPSQMVFAETHVLAEKAVRSGAGVVIVPVGFSPAKDIWAAVIAAKHPRLWFARAAKLLEAEEASDDIGVHPAAAVASDVVLGDAVFIGPGAVVGDKAKVGSHSRIEAGAIIGEQVVIGEHCRIYPRVVVYSGTEIGNRVVVHAGAVLGADGFGYVRDAETGAYTQFPQQGRLVIEDDVEIGANTTIDRGALAETRIRRGVKLDNLVHIGHNCDIGEDVVIAAQVGISGSSSVGKGAVLAGQVGIGDHAHVGAGVILGGQAGVLSGKNETTTGTVLWGTPAKPLREYLRELATLARISRRKKEG